MLTSEWVLQVNNMSDLKVGKVLLKNMQSIWWQIPGGLWVLSLICSLPWHGLSMNCSKITIIIIRQNVWWIANFNFIYSHPAEINLVQSFYCILTNQISLPAHKIKTKWIKKSCLKIKLLFSLSPCKLRWIFISMAVGSFM